MILNVKNLSKSFTVKKKKMLVLENINISVEKGDIYGIIGLSGEGKSTIVRCLNRLEQPDSGDIEFISNGVTYPVLKLKGKELNEYRKKVAMIFQSFNLFNQRTVYENIRFPLELNKGWKKEPGYDEKIRSLIKLVGLEGKEEYYPSQLSGGQKQRVAIARALINDPDILLCDEATSALDPTTAIQVLDLLKDLNKELGLTIIIIAHQMSVIERVCNKVAILSNHTIVEQGYLRDIFFNPKTEVGKSLIYGEKLNSKLSNDRALRLLFSGNVDEPILTLLVEVCNVLVSILMADTKVIDGKIYGQLIIYLPYYQDDINKVEEFLRSKNIEFEEISI